MAQHCLHLSRLCCLFCDKPQPSDENHGGLEIATHDKPTFWICEHCRHSETERTRALEAALLVNGETKRLDKTVSSSACIRRHSLQLETSGGENNDPNSNCACQACVERRHLEQEQIREVQDLQKCWVQLRHAIRQMYRDRLLKDGATGKGKKFDVAKLKELVIRLTGRDPHQLYQRLESQAREHVMELKVQLLQILVSPEKSGVSAASKNENDKNLASQMTSEIAKHFLRSLLACAGQFFDTVDNMRCCLEKLEKDHLEKFGITWRIVNCNLFDTIVYQDPLVQASLPEIYKQLGFTSVESDVNSIVRLNDHKPLPLEIAETMKNFIELDSTMAACREQMDKAQERMEDYLAQQMKIYKATLKAKQKMLKEDLEFFKQQRKLLEEYVSKKKEMKKTNNEEELAAFTEALRSLLTSNRQSREHSASTAECAKCHQRHCPCDECTISHLITCGLISETDEIELPDSIQFLEEMNDSSNESVSDSDESEYGSIDGCLTDEKFPGVDIICRKRTSIICSDGQKVTKVETTILPSSVYTLHNRSHSQSSLQQYMYNAYGDWEVSSDPSSWLFAGRWDQLVSMKCVKQRCHKRLEPEGQTDHQYEQAALRSAAAEILELKNKIANDCLKSVTATERELLLTPVPLTKTVENFIAKEAIANKKEISVTMATDKGQCVVNSSPSSTPLKSQSSMKQHQAASKEKCTNPDSPINKVPPELLKIMKDEKLAKAFALAAAKRNTTKTTEPYWKDLNLDVETIRKLCSQHSNTTATEAGLKISVDSKQTAVDPSVEDDDDSWSDRSSVSQKDGKHCDCCYCEMFGQGNSRVGRDDYPQIRERLRLKLKKKGVTTDHVPRECEHEVKVHKAEQVEGYRGDLPDVNDLVTYIEGSVPNSAQKQSTKAAKRQRQKQKKAEEKKKVEQPKNRPVSMHLSAEASFPHVPNPFHKRQRSLDETVSNANNNNDDILANNPVVVKLEIPPPNDDDGSTDEPTNQRRATNHADVVVVNNEEKRISGNSTSSVSAERIVLENFNGALHNKSEKQHQSEQQRPKSVVLSNGGDSYGKHANNNNNKMVSKNCVEKPLIVSPKKKNKKKTTAAEQLNPDEVFQPKDIDLNACDLDETDKEVELFKKFVMNCQPQQKREKVQLDIGNLLRAKKMATATAAEG